MKYFIYQGNTHDCGFASLKMFLAILAKDRSYLYIPKPAKREKYTAADLIQIANEYGVMLDCFLCDDDFFNDIKAPCLTMIDENHVILIKKKRKHSLICYDPEKGRIKIRKDEFLRRWRKLILEKTNDEQPYKIKKIRQKILPNSVQIFEAVFALFSSAVLITSFYLLNAKENYMYSFLFLFAFVVSQILEKLILYKQVYTFDKNYIPLYMENCKEKNKQKYLDYVSFKQQFFTSKRMLISSAIVAFLITFLLCFNDFRNIFVLLALILIKILEILLFQKVEENSKNQIVEFENLSFKENEEATGNALKANFKADFHILFNSVKDVFYIFVSFAFALIMLIVTGNSGCNFVIFHFVMYFEGANSFNQIINGLSEWKEKKKLEQHFFDSCKM